MSLKGALALPPVCPISPDAVQLLPENTRTVPLCSCDSTRKVLEADSKRGGDLYETVFLRSLTLRAQDKACPGGKKDSL
jgi:hypothetical protein